MQAKFIECILCHKCSGFCTPAFTSGILAPNQDSIFGFLDPCIDLVLKENLPSYHMLKKCGYVDEGVLVDENFRNDRYYDVVMMAAFENSADYGWM